MTGVQGDDGITARFATAATRASSPGSYPISVTLDDPLGRLADYDVTTHDGTLRVSYPFDGFQAPIDDTGVNVVKAGSTVPVKFSLGQDFGLDILAGGDADMRARSRGRAAATGSSGGPTRRGRAPCARCTSRSPTGATTRRGSASGEPRA